MGGGGSLFALQHLHDLGKPTRPGVFKRRTALGVGDVLIRAGVQQLSDDALRGGAAVGKDHGFKQGGPAEIVDVIDVDPCLDKERDRFGMALFGGRDEGGAAKAIGAREVCAMVENEAEDVDAAFRAGDKIGAVVDGVLGVDIGAGGEEQACGLKIVVLDGHQKRCLAAPIALIDRVAVCQRLLQGRDIPAFDGG